MIRCESDRDYSHERGIEWLQEIQEVISLLGLVKDRDYQQWSMTLLAFPTHDAAEIFYTCMVSDMGAVHREHKALM